MTQQQGHTHECPIDCQEEIARLRALLVDAISFAVMGEDEQGETRRWIKRAEAELDRNKELQL